MSLNVSELFGPTIQGEGVYTGVPSIFLRLSGCNLCCCFKDSVCDTAYTSIHPEPATPMSIEYLSKDIVDMFANSTGHPHLVITGGEPLLQQMKLIDVIQTIREDYGCYNDITIETNGTIKPSESLIDENVFWSVSPKLSTSCCFDGREISLARQEHHRTTRINLDALVRIVLTGNYQLKFVYSGDECVQEIKTLLKDIEEFACKTFDNTAWGELRSRFTDINEHVLLMPEGATREQLEATSEAAAQAAIANGWRFCDRTHIRIWDSKRKV